MITSEHDVHGLRVRATLRGGLAEQSLAALVPVLAAFPTVVGEGGEPALRVELSMGSGAELEGIDGATPLFFHGRTRVLLAGDELVVTDGWSRLHVARDGARVLGEIDPRSLDDAYSFAHATSFIALMLALRAHGLFHVHAGAVVSREGELVLVAGEGGSGKTSTTLAFLAAGWGHLGDDAVLVRTRGNDDIVVLRVPKIFHVHPKTLAAHPAIASHAGQRFRANHDKHALDPEAAFAGRSMVSAGAPRVLLFPEVTHGLETVLAPLSQAEALGELVRSSALAAVSELPRAREHLALLGRMVSAADAYSLRLGLDALADPGLVVRRLAEARAHLASSTEEG